MSAVPSGCIVITKGGKPVAAVVDIALYERIRRMRKDFDRMLDELACVGGNSRITCPDRDWT
jgi:prevent-host-death family protein